MNKTLDPWSLERTRPVRISCRTLFVRPVLCCLMGAGLLGTAAFGQPAVSPQPKPGTNSAPANRWLIIVETTKRMRPRADHVQEAVPPLVFSGMNGQMSRGDTLGLWTFNEELHTGQFPLQEWTPGNSQSVALEVSDFLKSQKYEKDSYVEKLVPLMQRVIKSSDFITILLISDGLDKIHGTPFDDKINAFYQNWGKQQEKARMPFITVFRAEHGVITNYALTIPPYPLELPPLPRELAKQKAEFAKRQIPPPAVVAPLIVHGKKPEPPAATMAAESLTNAASSSSTTNVTVDREPNPGTGPAATTAQNESSGSKPTNSDTLTIPEGFQTNNPVKSGDNWANSGGISNAALTSATAKDPETVPQKFWDRKIVWAGAGAGGVFILWFIWAMIGQSHAPFQVSLTRRSPDENQKK